MNRNKKGVMPDITREMYKRIKKSDRQQFTAFCTDLYRYGYEDGRESVPGVDLAAVCEVIEGTRGIGPKRSKEVKTQLEMLFKEGCRDADPMGGTEQREVGTR